MADKSALNSERMAWADGGRGLMEKGATGEVSVAEEGDESESVAMENLHSGGSAAVIVTVCYGDFYVKSVRANCVRSVIAVTNFVSAKLCVIAKSLIESWA